MDISKSTSEHEKLILALDVPTVKIAERFIATLGDEIRFYKIGHQLAYSGGLELARDLIKDGKKVFLDLKLLDIGNTIFHAVENLVKLNVDMLTIHAYPQAMSAAVEAARGSSLCLLGVTVLTSMNDHDLKLAGYELSHRELVAQRCALAKELDMGGVVASPSEAAMLRQLVGNEFAIVTPGVRPKGYDSDDQKRVSTPAEAIAAGASHLVIGRPIIKAQDPLKATLDILEEIGQSI